MHRGSPKGKKRRGGLDVEAEECTEKVQKEQVKVTGWSMKRREDRRYLMKKKISGKAIAAIIAALAVVGIAVYLIGSTSKQVVNIDISGFNEMTIMSGGTGKTITSLNCVLEEYLKTGKYKICLLYTSPSPRDS